MLIVFCLSSCNFWAQVEVGYEFDLFEILCYYSVSYLFSLTRLSGLSCVGQEVLGTLQCTRNESERACAVSKSTLFGHKVVS